ncbi:MAG: hypothetical protein ABEK12_04255 [Candidatus Nanohaloarchaea archaeon]
MENREIDNQAAVLRQLNRAANAVERDDYDEAEAAVNRILDLLGDGQDGQQ